MRGVSARWHSVQKRCQPFFLKKTIFRRKIMVFQKNFLIKIISLKSWFKWGGSKIYSRFLLEITIFLGIQSSLNSIFLNHKKFLAKWSNFKVPQLFLRNFAQVQLGIIRKPRFYSFFWEGFQVGRGRKQKNIIPFLHQMWFLTKNYGFSKKFFSQNKERRKLNIIVGLIKWHENGSRK